MNTALIIATHGDAAAPLLNTAQMIVGPQTNVCAVSFFPGENVNNLISKFEAQLPELILEDGVLFLVDMYAGSPFNAASLLAINKTNWDVVTGVNIPMLVNLFMERDEITDYNHLVETAIAMAKEGVKSLKLTLKNNNNPEEEL